MYSDVCKRFPNLHICSVWSNVENNPENSADRLLETPTLIENSKLITRQKRPVENPGSNPVNFGPDPKPTKLNDRLVNMNENNKLNDLTRPQPDNPFEKVQE